MSSALASQTVVRLTEQVGQYEAGTLCHIVVEAKGPHGQFYFVEEADEVKPLFAVLPSQFEVVGDE